MFLKNQQKMTDILKPIYIVQSKEKLTKNKPEKVYLIRIMALEQNKYVDFNMFRLCNNMTIFFLNNIYFKNYIILNFKKIE